MALDASQQTDVAVGDKVTIILPNNHTTPGVVSLVGAVAASRPGNSGLIRSSGLSDTSAPAVLSRQIGVAPAGTRRW